MQDRLLKTILPGLPVANTRRPRGAEAAWRTTRTVAAVFLLFVGVVLMAEHLGKSAIAPLKSRQLALLKEKLRLSPADDQIKQQIREADLEMREHYFRKLSLNASG